MTSVACNRPWQYPNIGSGIEWGRYTCYEGKSRDPGGAGFDVAGVTA